MNRRVTVRQRQREQPCSLVPDNRLNPHRHRPADPGVLLQSLILHALSTARAGMLLGICAIIL